MKMPRNDNPHNLSDDNEKPEAENQAPNSPDLQVALEDHRDRACQQEESELSQSEIVRPHPRNSEVNPSAPSIWLPSTSTSEEGRNCSGASAAKDLVTLPQVEAVQLACDFGEAAEAMTFSDAEEDQPTMRSNNPSVSSEASNSVDQSASASNDAQAASLDDRNSQSGANTSSNNDQPCSTSNSDAPSALVSHSQRDVSTNPNPSASSLSGQVIDPDSSSSAQEATHDGENVSHQLSDGDRAVTAEASVSTSDEPTLPDSMTNDPPIKDLNADKVVEKLQKIEDYIQQTTSTMQALETEGNMTKIGHYNTLAKVLRGLNSSKSNLESHLEKMREKEAAKKAKVPGSEAVGVVGNLTEAANSPSMEERFSRNQTEASNLTARLRDSVVRREELMTRYRATRQRLHNLKDQRRAIVAEERDLLTSQGPRDSPYEDPIPGAETWTTEQLRSGIEDFQGLWDKVDRLQAAYNAKKRATDPEDAGAVADVESKLQQLVSKKRQLDDVLQQLMRHLRTKENEGTGLEDQPPVAPSSNSVESLINGGIIGDEINETNDEETNVEFLPTESDLRGASSDITVISGDLISRKEELAHLQEQLSYMKQLLDQTESRNRANRNIAIQKQQQLQQEQQRLLSHDDAGPTSGEFADGAVNGLPSNTIVGIKGNVFHLSEIERKDPDIMAKFQNLSVAKRRLAKMEEIMNSIALAQETGQRLENVLTPECLEILNEEEFEGPAYNSATIASQNMTTSKENDGMGILQNDTLSTQSPAVRSRIVPRDGSTPEDSNSLQDQEMSAMHHHLNMNVASIPPLGEGSKAQKESSPTRKHTRNLWNESDSLNKSGDPRLNELLALHEELKEKKNALEALTKRMGKSSSFAIDNLSDNLSDNILDNNSDTMDKHPGWGVAEATTLLQGHSNDFQNDEDLAEDDFEMPSVPNAGQSSRSCPSKDPYEDRNKFIDPSEVKPQRIHRNSNQGRLSINNLSGSLPRSVRPKHNRPRDNMPKASWENVEQGTNAHDVNKQNAPLYAQNTISYTLAQLNMVQETIHSLYKNLQQSCQTTADSLPHQSTNLPYGNPLQLYSLPQMHQSMNFMAPPYASLPSNIPEPGRSEVNGPSNQFVAGLQQCFSQLYLHSLEIQSISKQVQLLEQKDKTPSPIQGRNTCPENRSCRQLWIPKVGEKEKPMPTGPPAPSSTPPPVSRSSCTPSQYLLPHQLNQNVPFPPAYHDNTSTSRPYEHFASVARRVQPFHIPDKSRCTRVTESLPMVGGLGSTSDEPDLSFGNQNFFPPFESSSVDETLERQEENLLQTASHIPLGSEDLPETLWGDMQSQQMQFEGSSDILNNQVPPGLRANNYWDNFRSYSHQNPLSNTTKQNTCEGPRMTHAVASGDRRHRLSNSKIPLQLSTSSLSGKREFNPTCNPNNFINKASEKNSATSRSLNKGARSRYPLPSSLQRILPYEGSIQPLNALSSDHGEQSEVWKRAFKRNNRQNSGDTFLQDQSYLERESLVETSSDNRSDLFNFNLGAEKWVYPQRYAGGREWCYSSPSSLLDPSNFLNQVNHVDNLQETPRKIDSHSQLQKEADLLMKKYAKQPEFLLNLFKHVSEISNNTDQQAALELLRELSNQRNNLPDLQQNSSSFRSSENSFIPENIPLITPLVDIRTRNQRNSHTRSSHLHNGAFGGSEASESGLTSEEEENKVFYRMFKNITPSSSVSHFPSNPPKLYGELATGISQDSHSYPGLMSAQPRMHDSESLTDLWKTSSKDGINAVSSHLDRDKTSYQEQFGGIERKLPEVTLQKRCVSMGNRVRTVPNQEPFFSSRSGHSNLLHDCKCNPLPKNKDSHQQPSRKIQTKMTLQDANFRQPETSLTEKMPSKNLNVLLPPRNIPEEQSSLGFETLATASLREVLRSFEWLRHNPMSPPQYLDALQPAIMRQVEKCSGWMGLSTDFISSFESHLKEVLQSFSSKQLPEIIQELAPAVTQVVINQCCTLLQNDIGINAPPQNVSAQNENLNIFLPFEFCSNSPSPTQASSSLNSGLDEYNSPIVASSHLATGISSNQTESAKSGAIQKTATSLFHSLNEPRNAIPLSLSRNSENARSFKESTNLSKAMGALLKSIPRPYNNESTVKENEMNGPNMKESPLSESSFPEAWIISPILDDPQELDNLSLSESSQRNVSKQVNVVEQKDFFIRSSLQMNTRDIEADQRKHHRTNEFHSAVLPVHDLAEADQSREVLELESIISLAQVESRASALLCSHHDSFLDPPEEGACGPPTPAPVNTNNVSPQEQEQVGHFIPKRTFISSSKGTPEQGLDEVPTKLLSPGSCTSPLANNEEASISLRRFENLQSKDVSASTNQGRNPDRHCNLMSLTNDPNSNSTINGSTSREMHSGNLLTDKSG